jgi:hypothetical protein
MGRGRESTIIRKKSALSPSPLPLCGIPTSISFVKEEWDICVGERVGVRGHRTKIFISPLICVARRHREGLHPPALLFGHNIGIIISQAKLFLE